MKLKKLSKWFWLAIVIAAEVLAAFANTFVMQKEVEEAVSNG